MPGQEAGHDAWYIIMLEPAGLPLKVFAGRVFCCVANEFSKHFLLPIVRTCLLQEYVTPKFISSTGKDTVKEA